MEHQVELIQVEVEGLQVLLTMLLDKVEVGL